LVYLYSTVTFILLPPEGRAGKAWELSKKVTLFLPPKEKYLSLIPLFPPSAFHLSRSRRTFLLEPLSWAIPRLRSFYTTVSPRRSVFDSRSIRVTLVAEKVTLRQCFIRDLRPSSLSISPPILHSHIHLNATKVLSEGKNGRFWEPQTKQCSF